MILTDAGPLIALLDRNDDCHVMCVGALGELTAPMVSTWPTFTEAMYLLGARAGWRGQAELWAMTRRGALELVALSAAEFQRTSVLMEKYRDVPMALAHATLVAVAEELGTRRVFTVDSDFEVYRYKGRQRFEIVPS